MVFWYLIITARGIFGNFGISLFFSHCLNQSYDSDMSLSAVVVTVRDINLVAEKGGREEGKRE